MQNNKLLQQNLMTIEYNFDFLIFTFSKVNIGDS